jgi:tRNA-splicing ligase RtcB
MASTIVAGASGAEAVVFLEKSLLDAETYDQIARMVDHPAVRRARVMPDCHKGTGCCVGFTCALGACVSPALIGGDIGCGISAIPVTDSRVVGSEKSLTKLLRTIHATVPMGNGAKGDQADVDTASIAAELEAVLEHAQGQLTAFVTASSSDETKTGVFGAVGADLPFLDREWLDVRLKTWGLPRGTLYRQFGTLGGGNHFIEVDALVHSDEGSNGDGALPPALLVVHSGSRCVGQAVYRYWMRRAFSNAAKDTAEAATEALRKPAVNDDDEIDTSGYGTAVALTGADAFGYYVDMIFAQSFALFNRCRMLARIAEAANITLPRRVDSQAEQGPACSKSDDGADSAADDDPLAEYLANPNRRHDRDDEEESEGDGRSEATTLHPDSVIDSTHNYIDFSDWIVRKGAIAARDGALCIVAQNMRDGIWLCKGRGNGDWNCSAPHGTGRIKGRAAAAARDKQTAEVQVRQFRAEMEGIITFSVGADTLDERPGVYRESAIVQEAMAPAVTVLGHYKPLLSAK